MTTRNFEFSNFVGTETLCGGTVCTPDLSLAMPLDRALSKIIQHDIYKAVDLPWLNCYFKPITKIGFENNKCIFIRVLSKWHLTNLSAYISHDTFVGIRRVKSRLKPLVLDLILYSVSVIILKASAYVFLVLHYLKQNPKWIWTFLFFSCMKL